MVSITTDCCESRDSVNSTEIIKEWSATHSFDMVLALSGWVLFAVCFAALLFTATKGDRGNPGKGDRGNPGGTVYYNGKAYEGLTPIQSEAGLLRCRDAEGRRHIFSSAYEYHEQPLAEKTHE